MNMNRDAILNRLSILDFMAVDLHLYLDTHPEDREVIAKYNEVIQEADEVRYEYEKNFGPLCSFRSMSPEANFKWIDSPWPWMKKFNHYISGEDC